MVYRGVLDSACGCQPVTAVFIFDVRPQQARCVQQDNAIAYINALLRFGDGRFVAGLGDHSSSQIY